MTLDEKRQFFLEYAMRWLGDWYIWGGDDPQGFDCSGLVVEGLQAVGLLNADLSADGLLSYFTGQAKIVTQPSTGCLVFWHQMPGSVATHVEICLNDELSIGAKGGNRNCTTIEVAQRMNAFVKVRPIARLVEDRGGVLSFADPFME